jgi:hypothetical protein
VFTDTVATHTKNHLDSVAGGYCLWQNALQKAILTNMHYLSRCSCVSSLSLPFNPADLVSAALGLWDNCDETEME